MVGVGDGGKQEGWEEEGCYSNPGHGPMDLGTKRLKGLRDPTQRGWERASLGEGATSSDLSLQLTE